MKAKQLFWGFIFITLGALALSARYDWMFVNYDLLIDMWPLILIFGGIAIIFRESKLRIILNILLGITVGAIFFAFIHNIFSSDSDEFFYDEEFDSPSAGLYENYSHDYDYADLVISGGVGDFQIDGTTDKLYEAIPTGIFQNYDVSVSGRDNNGVEVNFDLGDEIDLSSSQNNKLKIKLNENPIWSLELNLGAANSVFNLEDFKVRKIELSTGATNTKIKLGDRLNRTDIHIEMGAASVKLYIPEDAGCRVISSSLLVIKDLPDFIKKSDGNFETDDFNNADQKIFVNMEGGLANFEVIRY